MKVYDEKGRIQIRHVMPGLKAGTVTDTTDGSGEIAVVFPAAFLATPVVIVQLETDVDYYSVVLSKDANGFTVKMLKTAHVHTQGNTGAEAAHTHGISFASGSGTSHRHSNPNTSAVSAGTPSGSLGSEGSHTHDQGVTGVPSAYEDVFVHPTTGFSTKYAASISGGSPISAFHALTGGLYKHSPTYTHTHTNPATGAGSLHYHIFTGSALGTHSHTIGNTGYETSHTHAVSGTSGAGSSHAHTNPNTNSADAGNTLANTEVTFSYIAMVP